MSGMADKRASLTTEERRFADAVRSRLASAPEPKEEIARRAVRAGYSEGMAGIGALLLGPLAPLLAFVKPARPLPPPR